MRISCWSSDVCSSDLVATGVCAHLDDSDWVASTHRGHGHILAKGVDPRAMAAEFMGKETGICHGKGGPMHVADVSKGILGANGIVGRGVGLAVGAALGAQLDGEGRVAVVFFGDGASSQGVISEALNIARSEEHTSELQSLMRNSYAVFCLKKNKS